MTNHLDRDARPMPEFSPEQAAEGEQLRDAAVAAEWADHFEVCQGMVGTERLTVESMIASLRGPRPFGRMAGKPNADA